MPAVSGERCFDSGYDLPAEDMVVMLLPRRQHRQDSEWSGQFRQHCPLSVKPPIPDGAAGVACHESPIGIAESQKGFCGRGTNERRNMANLKKWTAVAAAGAALSLAGVIGVGPALAGRAVQRRAQAFGQAAVSHDTAVPFKPGTYQFFVNGSDTGAITFASGNTFTAAIDSDSGTWVQAGKIAGLIFTGGSDAAGGCVFAGHVSATGKAISSAAKPGDWACPGFGSAGNFYIVKSAGGARHRRAATSSPARARSPRPPDRSFPAPTFGPSTATTAATSRSPRATPTPAR